MTLTLYEHRNIALPVLKRMENKGKGGFITDMMGLSVFIQIQKFFLLEGGFKLTKDIIVGDDSSPRTVVRSDN